MERRSAVAIALGGVVGAGLRWSIVEAVDGSATNSGDWPWGALVANIVGCALLGAALSALRDQPASTVLGATVGFCGALTTFSAFAVDAALFLGADQHGRLITYVAVSFVAGTAAYLAGRSLRRPRGTPA